MATGCSIQEVMLDLDDDKTLQQLLGNEELHPGESYELDADELKSVVELYSIDLKEVPQSAELLRVGSDFRFDPNSHTGRELLLMLEGKKPFAAFVDVEPSVNDDDIIPEVFFAKHVASKRLEKRVHIQKSIIEGRPDLKYVMFSIPEETWRFKSYIALKDLGQRYGWNAGFEKIEGYLLGYEIEIDDFFKKT
jgi:hypothetical protein